MVLFQSDWQNNPAPKIHYETRNDSFRRMASLYATMDISNCVFMLSLYDEGLRNVDPHDPNLTDDQKLAVHLECTRNFWYFIREVIRIPASGMLDGVKYEASRGNIAMAWLFFAHIDTFLIMPRQTGKSVATDCIMLWLIYIGCVNNSFTLITKGDLRAANVARIKKMRDLLPKYLVKKSKRDPDNSEWIGYEALNNKYTVGIAQANETAANNLGRGITTAVVQFDEGPFLTFVNVTIPAALNATTRARELAKASNAPYANIFTTTAGRKDSREGKFFWDMLTKAAGWTEMFLDAKNAQDLEDMILANIPNGISPSVNITLSHRQLGKTDAWLRRVISENKNDRDTANRDFLNIWTAGGITSPLSIELSEKISSSLRDPVWTEKTKYNFMLRWYISKEDIDLNRNKTTYILGMDTSDNTTSGDATTFVVRDIRDMGVAAAGLFNSTNTNNVSNMLADFMEQHPNSVLIIERNRAQAIIDNLLIELPARGMDPFKRMYNTLWNDQTVRVSEYLEVIRTPLGARTQAFYDKRRTCFGFWTGTNSRSILYGRVLQQSAKRSGHVARDKQLVEELLGLQEKNGRVDHKSSGHDDMCISWLLGYWFATEARHLDSYGIDRNQLFSVKEFDDRITPEEQAFWTHQTSLRSNLNQIMDKLKAETDSLIISRLEQQLRSIRSRLVDNETELLSIDQLLAEASEARRERSRVNMSKARSVRFNQNIYGGLRRVSGW